jgi:2-polyprenyl-3-methyl-5-hydroxy-6-metoxy-1,4-benzoquinol methylase
MALQSLTTRQLHPELMDGPCLDAVEHARALVGLERLNLLSRACRGIWRQIVKRTGVRRGQTLRVLDVASGGGDVAFGLWRLGQSRHVDVQILGLDASGTACSVASQRCQAAGRAIKFQCADVTTTDLPSGFDIVTSSLFLHHLPWDGAVTLLAKMGAAGRLLVVSDLRRSAIGYAVAHTACRLVTRSRIVRYDGPQSVANAFTIREVREMCTAAGLNGAIVRRAWPWRLMVIHESEH